MDTKFAGSAYRYFLIWGTLASLAITICTIVDASLIGNMIGPDGLAVANLSTPVFLCFALLGITIGIGANVNIGRQLGASKVDEANRLFRSQIGYGAIVSILSLSPLLFKDAFFSFIGVTDELYPLADQYLTIVLWSAPMFIFYHILSVSVRTDSNPRLSAIASAIVIVTNITLDIVFMKVLNFGIIGASASLCIAETLGTLILLTHFLKKRRLLKLRISIPKLSDVAKFTYNGFGLGSAYIFVSVVMLVFNTLLLRSGGESGALYVAIYGVIYTISTIPTGVFDGASGALSTVTAIFVGESDTEGIHVLIKKALKVAIISGAVLAVICAVFAGYLVRFFGITDPAAVKSASLALRIFSISIVFTGVNTIITSFWQSIGRAKLAGAMSVIRNCLLMITIGLLLIPKANIIGLSISYICTEFVSMFIIFGILIFSSSRKYVEKKFGVKGRSYERTYLIKTESLAEISSDLEKTCDEWNIGTKQSFFINFVCEELLLNVIKFGLENKNPKKKYYISIKLIEIDDGFILRVRDNVSIYNPFESEGDEIDMGVLALIKKKTKYCDYQRKMIFNYLYMVI